MGVMVVLALYNLFVFISIRDRQYFLYVLLHYSCAQLSSLYKGTGPLIICIRQDG